MSRGIELALGLHLLAMIAGAGLLVLALRAGTAAADDPGEGDGPGGPPRPAPPPGDGPPLGDADPSRVRLRGPPRPPRLAPPPARRRAHPRAPDRPTHPVAMSASPTQTGHDP